VLFTSVNIINLFFVPHFQAITSIMSVFPLKLQGARRSKIIDKPLVMGIVNVTPDSFYSGSRSQTVDSTLRKVSQMIDDGVDIVDIGGMSSRPGAEELSIEEEITRLITPLEAVRKAHPNLWISVDTYRTEVLKACMDHRIDIINDISGGRLDESFLATVADSQLTYILMHMQGAPRVMQYKPQYEDVLLDIIKYTDERIHTCRNMGIEEIIVDPGFGFGKTIDDNYKLLRGLSAFQVFDKPVMVGLSRKSMIYKALENEPASALNGTTALHMSSLERGVHILRVHDVKEAKECIKLWSFLKNA